MNNSFLDENLTEVLDADLIGTSNISSALEAISVKVELKEGEVDPRLKQLSHSSRQTLHKCPRKFQLYRLNSKELTLEDEANKNQGVTFAFGTAVGVGIQSALEGKPDDQVILDTFLAWDVELLDENLKQKKSIWEAIFAVKQLIAKVKSGYLQDYELAYYKGKPAVELSFKVTLPDGYAYRGYVDAVLVHKVTGKVLVLEAKTTSGKPNEANYKNSGQAIGYSIVLDKLFKNLSDYSVLYLVYSTSSRSYTDLVFAKSLLQRALWLQELMIDTQHVTLYEHYETYPSHGENCYDFFRECEYLGLCTLETTNLTKPLTQTLINKVANETYDITVDFYELIDSQLAKGTGE